MKREDVSKIIPGITSDQLDSIMNLHGADITAKVNEITTLKAENHPDRTAVHCKQQTRGLRPGVEGQGRAG